jgi:hypothetical protein
MRKGSREYILHLSSNSPEFRIIIVDPQKIRLQFEA